jgi:MoxR-like ATPase
MSEFIRVLNAIKRHWDPSWLTESQQRCLDELTAVLRVPRTVNLNGKHGVGKTFLAWALARESDFLYCPDLDAFQAADSLEATGVIIDNCLPTRAEHRDILRMLDFRGVKRAVLVTTALIQDDTHYCQLVLTPQDIAMVQDNLASIGTITEVNVVFSLWDVVNPHSRC